MSAADGLPPLRPSSSFSTASTTTSTVGGGGGAISSLSGPLARVNGEGDASSVTSSVVQRLWPKVLALARDVPPPETTAGSGATEGGAEPPLPSASEREDDGRAVRRCVSRVLGWMEDRRLDRLHQSTYIHTCAPLVGGQAAP